MGPVRKQSEWLVDMLRDPDRTRVHLVTLAEEMPVTETLETAAALEDQIGIDSGTVFANAVYSELLDEEEAKAFEQLQAGVHEPFVEAAMRSGLSLDAADLDELVGYGRFLQARRSIQRSHLDELRAGINEPVVELPFLFSAGLALPDIETLADAIEAGVSGTVTA
jgi:anion-transporting  ArsA/GET3 family ATPase